MQIGQVIRKYRKEQNMTQEEMAQRLGVTTPAVNKWENGNSYPDIMMLAPIARLLHISLDTLLSFQEELTENEITAMTQEADERLKKDAYDEVFQWAKDKIEMYPNCKVLIWQLAIILDAKRLVEDVPDDEKYDAYILSCYERVLESEDEKLRTRAADSLFSYYFRKDQYEKAEEYLAYYSEQNPERKRMQASIYSKTGRREEAYKAYEELLFSGYQTLSMILHSIYMLAMEDSNMDKAAKGWLKSFAEPMPVVLPINILELFIKPLSLCMRLFGNVLGAFVIMELLKMVVPMVLPAVFSCYFDIFDGLIQAYVFVFLTSLFIKEATE